MELSPPLQKPHPRLRNDRVSRGGIGVLGLEGPVPKVLFEISLNLETLFFFSCASVPGAEAPPKGPEHNSKVQLCCQGLGCASVPGAEAQLKK